MPSLLAARRALEIDPNSWMAHAFTGIGELWANKHHERALLHLEKALEINPSAAMTYHLAGCIAGFAGYPTRAIGYQERLLRIDPANRHRAVIEADLSLWHLLDRNFEDASKRIDCALLWNPKYARAWHRKAVLSGLTGDQDGAHEAALAIAELRAPLTPETIDATYPFRVNEHRTMFLDGLRMAGLKI